MAEVFKNFSELLESFTAAWREGEAAMILKH